MSTVPIVPEPKVPEPTTQQPTAQVRPFRLGVPSVNVPEIFPGFKLQFGEAEFRIGQSGDRLDELLGEQRNLNVEIQELEVAKASGTFTAPGIPTGALILNNRQEAIRDRLVGLQVTIETEIDTFASAEWQLQTLATYIPNAIEAGADDLLTEKALLDLAPYTTRSDQDKEFVSRVVASVKLAASSW